MVGNGIRKNRRRSRYLFGGRIGQDGGKVFHLRVLPADLLQTLTCRDQFRRRVPHALDGETSSPNPKPCATGRMSVSRYDLWYNPLTLLKPTLARG